MNAPDPMHLLRVVRTALQNANFPEAIDALQQAAMIAHQAGDFASEGRHLGNLALIYYRVKQPDEALSCFERALAIAQTENDRLTEDGILGNMGNILREVGRHDAAIQHLNQALLIAQEIGDVRGRGIWLTNLGLVYDDLRRLNDAIDAYKEAVSVARGLRDQRGLASRLSNLGNTYVAAVQPAEALKCFHEVVAIYKLIGEKPEAALRMGVIGDIYNDLGQRAATDFEALFYYDLAKDAYKDTLELVRELGDRAAEGEMLLCLGNVAGNSAHFAQARANFEAAYAVFREIGLVDRLPTIEGQIALTVQLEEQQS
jgi:tetratricopeptide (TPR) repeat protein